MRIQRVCESRSWRNTFSLATAHSYIVGVGILHVITGAPLPTHHSSREYTGISVKNEAPSSTRSCHRALFQPPDSYSPPHAANRRLNATPGRGAAQRLKCTYTNLSGMTGPRARMLKGRQHPDNTEPARWAAEGIFLLRRDTKGFATCPLRLVFSYCCTSGICTQIQPCTIRDVLALFSNKRTPDALENTGTAKEKATGIQSEPPLALRRTTQCLEHLKLESAMLTAEVTVLTSVPIQKPAAFLHHLLLMAPSTASAPKLSPHQELSGSDPPPPARLFCQDHLHCPVV